MSGSDKSETEAVARALHKSQRQGAEAPHLVMPWLWERLPGWKQAMWRDVAAGVLASSRERAEMSAEMSSANISTREDRPS